MRAWLHEKWRDLWIAAIYKVQVLEPIKGEINWRVSVRPWIPRGMHAELEKVFKDSIQEAVLERWRDKRELVEFQITEVKDGD